MDIVTYIQLTYTFLHILFNIVLPLPEASEVFTILGILTGSISTVASTIQLLEYLYKLINKRQKRPTSDIINK